MRARQVSSPIIDTRTLEANVLIKSGCTLAIGGLLQDEVEQGRRPRCRSSETFRSWVICSRSISTARTKRNLLIFVTPTIITQTYGTGLEDQINGLKNSNTRTDVADINGWRNNAKGAIHLVKPKDEQLAGQYPAPGNCNTTVSFKDSAAGRGDN